MRLIDGKITVEQVRDLLDLCYEEFCRLAGDGVCGCDVCPYRESDADTGEDCYEAYIKDKLNEQSRIEYGTENAVEFEPVRHAQWIHTASSCNPFWEVWRCSYCSFEDESGCCYNYCPSCGARMDVGRE